MFSWFHSGASSVPPLGLVASYCPFHTLLNPPGDGLWAARTGRTSCGHITRPSPHPCPILDAAPQSWEEYHTLETRSGLHSLHV